MTVTGPTGTCGFGLVPLLQQDERVQRVVGIARRPVDPAQHGWTKMEYRQGGVRDQDALRSAFAGADAVVHLAFLIVGGTRSTTRAIDVEGTLHAFGAAAEAGVRRFVYASSVAAYGFHSDNPVGMTEDWPTGRRTGSSTRRRRPSWSSCSATRRRSTPTSTCTCCAHPWCSARTPSVARTCCPALWRRSRGRCKDASAASRSRCRHSCRTCRCSWCTRTTSVRRCCGASSPRCTGLEALRATLRA